MLLLALPAEGCRLKSRLAPRPWDEAGEGGVAHMGCTSLVRYSVTCPSPKVALRTSLEVRKTESCCANESTGIDWVCIKGRPLPPLRGGCTPWPSP
ncbi:BQ2448_2051 [Microbotryum intermedium]|uniref:BQ2448_2051 protein n=1 Tax=Microbotryum intermedium TaxID=269621 RepID=A0A238FA67_9BASI|nr:BQ2448_2051 [Microbotryum intermedium]